MSSPTALADPQRFDEAFPGASQMADLWRCQHEAARKRGGYLGSDWGDREFLEHMVDRFCLPFVRPDCVALELGPGGGRYTQRLLPHFRQLDVVDLSADVLRFLQERLGDPPTLRCFQGNGRTLEGLELDRYDFVYAFNLFPFLELENIYAYLRDLRPLLRDDGIAVVQYADFSNQHGRKHFTRQLPAWNQHARIYFKFHYINRSLMNEVLTDLGYRVVFEDSDNRDSIVAFTHDGDAARRRYPEARAFGGHRWYAMPPALDGCEREWWEEQGAIERDFADARRAGGTWVAKPRHLRKIAASLPEGATVVDFGCGSGWVSRQLAAAGASDVIGIDFSESQLETARRALRGTPHADRVRFVLSKEVPQDLKADAVVCHAVLHHLTWQEIEHTLAGIDAILVEGGTLWVIEPVTGERRYLPWGIVPRVLMALFSTWRDRRPVSAEERALRTRLRRHRHGMRYPGHGPSPKELPFRVGDIETVVGERLELIAMEPVSFNASHVAGELQVFGVTFPRLARLLRRPALWLAMAWERLALRFCPEAFWKGWVFTMFRFRKRAGSRS